jgi:4-hydroxythreonine-4-phosphate dehydrogenase
METSTPRALIVTQGDPLGIGPELLLRLAAQGQLFAQDRVIADPGRLEHLSTTVSQPWARPGWRALEPLLDPESTPGLLQTQALAIGTDQVLQRAGTALVTAPIDKAVCKAEGFKFPGHTEYLAHRAGVTDFAMALVGSRLRVALVTIHEPLRRVPDLVTTAEVERVICLFARELRGRFGVERPRIGVLGLNPHAGEGGVLGHEEGEVITPAIVRARQVLGEGVELMGPVPADTAFHAQLQGAYDGLVAMYHDQALGPFKVVHFTDGVNVTLGLPFVRTSPDHGTARDLVGTGRADPSSMVAALALARGASP